MVGDLLTDVVVRIDGPLRPGSDTPARIVHGRGGSAANVAVAAASAGTKVRFVGQVGDDARGRGLVGELEAGGVEADVRFGGTTGTVVVLVDGKGERSFLTDRSAAVDLVVEDEHALDDVSWLHIAGYSFAEGALSDAARRLAGAARDRSIGLSVSTSSVGMIEDFGIGTFRELMEDLAADVLVANADEAELLELDTGADVPATLVIVTDGASPTRLLIGGQLVAQVPAVEVTRVEDTTGAGDAFTGGLLASLLDGDDPVDAVAAGNQMAARALLLPGARLDDGPPT